MNIYIQSEDLAEVRSARYDSTYDVPPDKVIAILFMFFFR